MAQSFPLSIATFMDQLPIQSIMFETPEQVEINQTAGGEQLSADLAPMLWQGEVKLGVMTSLEAEKPIGYLDLLRPSGRTFYCYDTRRPAPRNDPTGAILGASTPTIYAMASNREMQLEGVPVGYNLARGDYLAFDYGSPSRRALHRITSEPGVATTVLAWGIPRTVTPNFEVHPPIRPGATTGLAVTLVKAACKAVLVRGSLVSGASHRGTHRDLTFRFMQTLR